MFRRLAPILLAALMAAPALAGTTNVKVLNAATTTGAREWVPTQDNGKTTSPGVVGAVQVTLFASGATTSSVTYQTSPDQSAAYTAYTFTNIGATPVTIQCSPSPYGRLNYVSGTGTITGFITTMAAPQETGGCHLLANPGTITMSGATGTGALVLATSPTLVTPVLGVATATSINGNTITTGTGVLTIAAAKTLTANNTITLAGTDATTMTFPTTSATVARTDAANTFTGVQTFSSVPVFSAGSRTAAAKLTDGAIAVADADYFITKGSALGSSTLATPTATTHDGWTITFTSTTAFAHVITVETGKVNGAAATSITFTSAAIGDSVTLKAWQGIWYIVATRGTITLA